MSVEENEKVFTEQIQQHIDAAMDICKEHDMPCIFSVCLGEHHGGYEVLTASIITGDTPDEYHAFMHKVKNALKGSYPGDTAEDS